MQIMASYLAGLARGTECIQVSVHWVVHNVYMAAVSEEKFQVGCELVL